MLRVTSGAARATRVGLMAAALALRLASGAAAQTDPLVIDGNIFFDNGSGGTAHFTGAAAAGSPCLPGLDSTTASIVTVQYANNSVNVDPRLGLAIADPLAPHWQPAMGSPAYAGNAGHGKTVELPADPFLTPTCFVGAVGPQDDWTQGWTYYGLDGGGRTFPARPLVIVDNHNLYSNRTFSADSNYLVRGQCRVKAQATLTIQPGTYVFEETATTGVIVIERGGRIVADGTAAAPIVITSDQAPGSQFPGGSGGLVIHGRARSNRANTCAGDSIPSEGGLVGYFGGDDDADDSGVLRYVRVEFGGKEVAPNNELNAFTFNAVGSGTVIEHLQAHRGSDDLFEWFGGAAHARYLLGTYGFDDGLDWQLGFRGTVQFAIIRQLANELGLNKADCGIEADNDELDFANELCAGRSNPILANLTLIGDRTTGTGFGGVTRGILLRRGTSGRILNSIVTGWKTAGVSIVDGETFANHCRDRAGVAVPAIQCDAATLDVPALTGRVFVASGFPNPFRSDIAIRFALPHEEHVTVDVFAADGRLVQRIADRSFAAGEHALSWKVGRQVPSGVYFYRVDAAGQRATGRIVRVD